MQPGDPIPKIRHTNIAKVQKKFNAVLGAFARELSNQSFEDVKMKTFEVSEENLLCQRKKLVASIKLGMLERKNMEMEIATLAAIVWFLRLDKERQERIEGLW